MSTDIDILVSLGYSKELSRRALAATKGDRKAALDLIKNNRKITGEDGWKTDQETDWVRLGINGSSSLPKDATMRALWKTPISIHVGSYRLGSAKSEHEVVIYRCRVITHTADWVCEKTYRDFEEFKHSLPFGTTIMFTAAFPYPLLPLPYVGSIFNMGGMEMDNSEAEKRRQMLDEWMRELTMSEKCMSNDEILQKVRSFVAAADNTKPSTELAGSSSTATTAASTPSAPVPPSSSLAKPAFSPMTYCPIVDKQQALSLTIKQIRKFLPIHFPVTVAQLDDMLSTAGPFRLDIADFKGLSNGVSTIDDDQLRKDLSRDRIVVNGRRFQGGGSSSSFQEIVGACSNTVIELMSSAQLLPLSSPSDSETFVKSLLKQLSRTESAFLSLCMLNTIVDIPGSSEEGSNIVLVPEAMLAEPMQLTIELLERKPSSSMSTNKTHAPASSTTTTLTTTKSVHREYCIDCELNTSTVYRFCDEMTMSTLLQCRVVYSKRVYGMLGGSNGSNTITEKAGKSYLVFIRETKTTARDWKQPS